MRVAMVQCAPARSAVDSQCGVGLGAGPLDRLGAGPVRRLERGLPVRSGGEGSRKRTAEGVTGTDRVHDVRLIEPYAAHLLPSHLAPAAPERHEQGGRDEVGVGELAHLRLVDDDRVHAWR